MHCTLNRRIHPTFWSCNVIHCAFNTLLFGVAQCRCWKCTCLVCGGREVNPRLWLKHFYFCFSFLLEYSIGKYYHLSSTYCRGCRCPFLKIPEQSVLWNLKQTTNYISNPNISIHFEFVLHLCNDNKSALV